MPPPTLSAAKVAQEIPVDPTPVDPNLDTPAPTPEPTEIPSDGPTPQPSDMASMFADAVTVPAPVSEAAPAPILPLAAGQVSLLTSDFVFKLNQSVILTVTVYDDGNSTEGFNLTLTLPLSLTINDTNGGNLSSSTTEQTLVWALPKVTSTTPFVRQVVIQAGSGNPGDSFLIRSAISNAGYQSRESDIVIGLGNLNNHDLFVLLDPQTVAEGVTVVSAPVTDSLTGTVSAAAVELLEMSCGNVGVECWGAQSSLTQDEWIDQAEPDAPTPGPSVNRQYLYLPLIKGIAGNANNSQLDAATVQVAAKPAKPLFVEGGIAMHSVWRLKARKLLQQLQRLDRSATLIFSAKPLIKRGIDPANVQLWTRPDAAAPNSAWSEVRVSYDAQRQVFVAVTNHFSPWALGDGLVSRGQFTPSTRNFATDLFNGTATINIPIEAPNGLGGMNPGISLSYSSRTSDDVDGSNDKLYDYAIQGDWAGGLGWGLGGMNYISASPTGYSLVLNGMALKLTSAGGDNYQTEPDMHLKITHGGSTCPGFTFFCDAEPWTVITQEGTTYRFGGVLVTTGNPNVIESMDGLVVSPYTAVQMVNHPNTPGSITGRSYTRLTGMRWYLREAVDTLGNRMEYDYDTESQGYANSCPGTRPAWTTLVSGTEQSGVHGANTNVTRATYLREVRWSAYDGLGQTNDLTPTMKIVFTRVGRTSDEIQIDYYNNDCLQPVYTAQRLGSIEVQVRTGPNWNAGNYQVLRSYVLNYQIFGCGSAAPCHAELSQLDMYGKGGTNLLQSYTFTYQGSNNQMRLDTAENGFGGKTQYQYTGVAMTSDVACIGDYEACRIEVPLPNGSHDLDRWRIYYSLSRTDTWDGLGNRYATTFAYNGSERAIATSNDFEWLGHSYANVQIQATNQDTQTVREEEHFFHQITITNTRDTRRGKEYQSVIWNGPKSANKKEEVIDTAWKADGNWVHQDVITTTLCSPNGGTCANKASKLFYATDHQGNAQYGNVTKVEEYSNNYLLRSTETWYVPNPSAWIVNKPAHVLVNGRGADNVAWVCLGDKRMGYDDYDGKIGDAPTLGLLTTVDSSLTTCGDADPIDFNTKTNWSSQHLVYDAYGNQTVAHTAGENGSQYLYIQTDYDTTYHLFPIKRGPVLGGSYYISETASYYGINASDQNGSIPLSDTRASWGALAEHCAVNGVCARQSYDVFGRPTNRWEGIAQGSTWDLTVSTIGAGTPRTGYYKSANTQWSYYKPGQLTSNNTFIVSEWRSPRCFSGPTRSHYNGLGQLVLEQRPYQDWEHRVDSCGATDNAGSEIYTHYGYNSLGQQVRVSVPESQARSVYDDAVAAETTRWTGKSYSLTDFDAIGRPLQSYAPNGEMTYHGYAGHNHATFQQTRDGGYDKSVRWESIDLYGQLEYIRTYYWGLANSVWGWQQDSQVTLTHDASGNLTKVERTASGSTTTLSTMSYDLGGRKLNMNDSDLGNWQYSYDRLSNLTRQTDARGWSTCLHYDGLQRLVSKNLQLNNTTCPSSPTYQISYAYDQGHSTTNRSKGQLTGVGFLDNHFSKGFTYNAQGLLVTETVGIAGAASGFITQYDYDSYMRPITTTYPDGEVIATTYNSMGLPAKLSSSLGGDLVDGHMPIGSITDAVNYDVAGRLTSMRFPLGNNVWRTQSYFGWTGSTADSNGRLSTIKVSTAGTGGAYSNSGNLLNLSYSYDSFSNIDQLVERYNSSTPVTNTFSYDAQNRLTNGYGQSYAYDPGGRLTSFEGSSYTAYRGNAVTHVGGTQRYWYDANGNLTTRWTSAGNQSLTWDAENHLTSITGAGGDERYLYDADGQRVKKVEETATTWYPNSLYEVSTLTRTIDNVGFESPTSWITASSWMTRSVWPNTAFFQSNFGNAQAHSGSYGASISNHAYGWLESNAITISAGSSYSLTAWVRGELDPDDSTGKAIVRAVFYNGSTVISTTDVLATTTLSTTWSQPVQQFVAPTGSTSLRIRLFAYMIDGWVAFDDITLKQMVGGVPGSNLVSVASFEATGGWNEVPEANYPNTVFHRDTWGSSAPHTGSWGYSISNQAYAVLQTNPITVAASTGYDFYSYLKGQIDGEATGGEILLKALYYNGGSTPFSTTQYVVNTSTLVSTTWISAGSRITTPVGTTTLRLELHSGMFSGWVAFDDVSLKQAGSSTNLVTDPSFDNTTSGWIVSAGTDFPGTMMWRGNWGPAQARTGTYSYLLSNWVDGYWQAKRVGIKGGEQVDLYTWVKGKIDPDTSQGKFLIRANFYDSNGSYISRTDLTAMNPGAITTWTRVGGRVTAPATAATMDVIYYLYQSSGWVNIDDVEVNAVTPPANYITKYYYFNGQRVAMRVNGVLTYLHTDHLGSTVLETNSSGAIINDEKYRAFGKQRDTGIVGTDYQFTGQKQDASGLQYFNSRFFDPQTGMFVSPDTIVPDAGLVSDYNRFMYARGNSLKYNDPSGHCIFGLDTIVCIYAAIAAVTAGSALIVSADTANHHEPTQEEINSSRLGGVLIAAGAGGLVAAAACASMPEKCEQLASSATNTTKALDQAVQKGLNAVQNNIGRGYNSFDAFKRVEGAAGSGQAWHHIVGQQATNVAKFGSQAINNTNNLIRLPTGAGTIHQQITNYYNSIDAVVTGSTTMRVREWLATQSFEAQWKFGIELIKKYGGEQYIIQQIGGGQ